jgi:hypothetical protein
VPSILIVFNDDGTVTWKPAGSASGGGGSRYNWINAGACPEHGRWKVIPGGYSEKKGADYDAFYTCSDRDCLNRPGRDWVAAHPASDEGDSDLPF